MIPNFGHLTQLQRSNFKIQIQISRLFHLLCLGTGLVQNLGVAVALALATIWLLKSCGYGSFSGGSYETEILYIPLGPVTSQNKFRSNLIIRLATRGPKPEILLILLING
jgi:hypothetical protein